MGAGSAPRRSLLQPPAAQGLPLSAASSSGAAPVSPVLPFLACPVSPQAAGHLWRECMAAARDSLTCASPSDKCHGRRCSHQGELDVAAGTSSSAARPGRDEIEWVKGMEA